LAPEVGARMYQLERWVSELPQAARDAFRRDLFAFETIVRVHERQQPPQHQRTICEVCGQKQRLGFYETLEIHPECQVLA
jgi:hypothetical protein